jgi:hypothetical protein
VYPYINQSDAAVQLCDVVPPEIIVVLLCNLFLFFIKISVVDVDCHINIILVQDVVDIAQAVSLR